MRGKETCGGRHVHVFSLRSGDLQPRGRCVARRIPVSRSEQRPGLPGGAAPSPVPAVGIRASGASASPLPAVAALPLLLLLLLITTTATAAAAIAAVLANARWHLAAALISGRLTTRASRTCLRAIAARAVSWEEMPVRVL